MAEDSAETGAELFGGGDDFQGTERRQALLDEYKLFVGTMENAVARRQRVNSFYLTGHSILVGAIGVMIQQALKESNTLFGVWPLAAVGILLCVNWRRILQNYQQLNAAKFEVLHHLEKRLPAALFKAEWAALDRGTGPRKYKPISGVEKGVATAFMVLYGLALAGTLAWWIYVGWGTC